MSTQEKKKKAYKVAPVSDAVVEEVTPKKKRIAKTAPIIEAEPEPISIPIVVPVLNDVDLPVAVIEPKKKRAYKTRVVPTVTPTPTPNPVPGVQEPPKKRAYKIRSEIKLPVAPPIPVAKEKKKRVVKVKDPIKEAVSHSNPYRPKAIESSEAPIRINDEDVLVIHVRKIEVNGKFYFLNSAKDKLYTVGTDGQPFQYYGRYNKESESINTDFADSDAEY